MASVRDVVPRDLEPVGARLAHELKNPLSAMKALVQLGQRNPAEAPSHERLASLAREIDRMQELLRRYLTPGRPLEEAAPAGVRLGSLVADALLALSARADAASVRLTSRGDALVEGDPRRLEEAILNLISNGIEATPPGGEVVVEVRPGVDEVDLLVRDTGRGMAPESLRRLGTPFFTTREEGTGLGVALARSVIAQHGGSLRYESEPGKGTIVTARFPRRARAA